MGKHYTQFSILLLDSIITVDKKYYPQVFLRDCKYAADDFGINNNNTH